MGKINTLVFVGGSIHDWKGCSEVITDVLSDHDAFELTKIEDDLDALISPNLDPYDLIVFYYTVGEINDAQKNGLLNYVSSGKGYVGIHSAADSFRNCPEYRSMVGGHFITHPHYREYQVSITDPEHPITTDLVEFNVTDEQYILDYDHRVNVLASALHKGSMMPVAWTKHWGQGRVFYLALGHDKKACQHHNFATLLQRGALWAGTSEI